MRVVGGIVVVEPGNELRIGGKLEMPIPPVVPLDPTIMKWYHTSDSPASIPGDTSVFPWRLVPVPDQTDIYTDNVFTYTRSYDGGHALYTRRMTKLFLPPNLIDIGTTGKAINISGTGRNPDSSTVVYIGKRADRMNTSAIIIYSIGTLSNPDIWSSCWRRTNTDEKFHNYGGIYIKISAMEGNESSGYYITEGEYYGTDKVLLNHVYHCGVEHAFGAYTYCTSPNMVDYDPFNWKRWDEVADEFEQ
jgi:hypothetical protein